MSETKSYSIAQEVVLEAYKRVKANKGAAGVDGQSITKYEEKLEKNLYKLWNRMSSGSYMPSPVRVVMIPKADGKERALGYTDDGRPDSPDGSQDNSGAKVRANFP